MNLLEKNTTFKRLYSLKHSPINVYFNKNSDDFVVREKALYEFSNQGEHLIMHICKKDLSTNEALQILSETSGIKIRDFGYAGLKDKQGFTFQYISVLKKFKDRFHNFSHPKLKILEYFTHHNKLKIGHLKGNSFFIRLKKVSPSDALKLKEAFNTLNSQGFANYFGYQRFGKFGDNYLEGIEILKGKKIKNPKLKNFLISALQSEFFNRYLSKRIEISHFIKDFNIKELTQLYPLCKEELQILKKQKNFFKILKGDVLGHYPYGKCFICEDLNKEQERFFKRDISALGLLVGKKVFESLNFVKELESEAFKELLEFKEQMQGTRRFMWSYMENAKFHYNEEKAHVVLEFFLQKGSYATTILEELLHTNLKLDC